MARSPHPHPEIRYAIWASPPLCDEASGATDRTMERLRVTALDFHFASFLDLQSKLHAMSTDNPYEASAAAPTMGGSPPGPKPKNYLVESILVTLCCCAPLGIGGIVFAAKVDGKYNSGDYAGAVSAAEMAKKLCIIGLVLGLVLYALVIGLQVLAIGAAGAGAGGGQGF